MISEQGTQETIEVEHGLPRSDSYYETCLDATSSSAVLACMRDPIGDVQGTCE